MVSSTEAMISSWNGRFFQIWMTSTFQPNLSFSMRSGRSMMPSYISALFRMPLKARTLRMRNAATSAGTKSGIFTIDPMMR